VLDGELVALDENGRPDFPLICECLLQRQFHISSTFMGVDVLSLEGESVTALPYSRRRALLEELRIDGPQWRTPENFDDGEALWEAVWGARTGGRRREAPIAPVPAKRSRLDQDEEPRLLALRDGARRSAEDPARTAVRLAHQDLSGTSGRHLEKSAHRRIVVGGQALRAAGSGGGGRKGGAMRRFVLSDAVVAAA
jgi:hypothetical protein